jgi:hypothetical protein
MPSRTKTPPRSAPQYPLGATVIASASISSYGHTPSVCAVDSARVRVAHELFPGSSADLLVLTADFGVSQGAFDRVAYQVTVLAPTQAGFDYTAHVLQLGPGAQPN